jgi:hypothetical protein
VAEWREAAQIGDYLLFLTVAELRELGSKIQGLLQTHAGRLEDPPGARDLPAGHEGGLPGGQAADGLM